MQAMRFGIDVMELKSHGEIRTNGLKPHRTGIPGRSGIFARAQVWSPRRMREKAFLNSRPTLAMNRNACSVNNIEAGYAAIARGTSGIVS